LKQLWREVGVEALEYTGFALIRANILKIYPTASGRD
jgi:hypothetical protein